MIGFKQPIYKTNGISLLYHTDNIAENIAYILSISNGMKKDFINGIESYGSNYIYNMLMFMLQNSDEVFGHSSISFIIDLTHKNIKDGNVIKELMMIFNKSYIIGRGDKTQIVNPTIRVIESDDKRNMILTTDLKSICQILSNSRNNMNKTQMLIFFKYIVDSIMAESDDELLNHIVKSSIHPEYKSITKSNNNGSVELANFYRNFTNKEESYHGKTRLKLYASPLSYEPLKLMADVNFLYTNLKHHRNSDEKPINIAKDLLNSIISLTYMIDAPYIINNIMTRLLNNNSITIVNNKDNIEFFNNYDNKHNEYVINGKLYKVDDVHKFVKALHDAINSSEGRWSPVSEMVLPHSTNYKMFITAPISSYITAIIKGMHNIYQREEIRDILASMHNVLIVYNILY